MTTALATAQRDALIERIVVHGDLEALSPAQRMEYYTQLCHSLGLNPLTRPFAYIKLSGKLTLYALKDCTEQLRKKNGVSITDLDEEQIGDVYRVKAKAQDRDGRTDASIGVVTIKGLQGDNLANALMKAETKAKRRVTLSICGLGMLDETETETIPGAELVTDPAPVQPPIEPPRRRSETQGDPLLITEPQRKRLFARYRSAGHTDADVRDWLRVTHGIEHSKDISRDAYDGICDRLSDPAPLFEKEPGADG